MIFDSVKEKFFFYFIPSILFSLIPFFLITGPFLSDLSISLISLLFLFFCLKKKNFLYFNNKYFYFFLIFWCYLMLSTILNNFNIDSLKVSFFYFRYGVFVIAILALFSVDDKFIKYFFYCIFICLIALILDGFYQYFFGENILGFKTENNKRVSSFFHDEQILGSYLSRILPIFLGLSISTLMKKNKLTVFLFLIFLFSEALIFLSGDRAAFFFTNLSAVFIILFSQKLIKFKLSILFSCILLLVLVSFINPKAYERVVDQSLKEMNLLTNKDDKKDNQIIIFTRAHNDIYISAYNMFLDNKIMGVGVRNFRNICKDSRYYVRGKEICYTHPHNTYLQILVETGIIGFLFLFSVLFYFCKHVLKHLTLKFKGKYYFNDFEVCILSGIAIYLWPLAPTGNVFSNWLNIAMILNLPLLIWSIKLKKPKN